jgi:hypothetical protein
MAFEASEVPEIAFSSTEHDSATPLNLCIQDNAVSQSRGIVRNYTLYNGI